MELTTKGRYAVMAMADIAHQQATGASQHEGADLAVPLSQVAERQHISLPYLEQLFLKLRRSGLVESARGRTGGYRLARPANGISIAEIMEAVEEGVRMTRCHGEAETPCLEGKKCLTHGLWADLGAHIRGFLTRVTLADVIADKGSQLTRPDDVVPRSLFSGGLTP